MKPAKIISLIFLLLIFAPVLPLFRSLLRADNYYHRPFVDEIPFHGFATFLLSFLCQQIIVIGLLCFKIALS